MLPRLYLALRRVFELLLLGRPSERKGVDIRVLRPELGVLRLRVARTRYKSRDLAALSDVLPRTRCTAFAVMPETPV